VSGMTGPHPFPSRDDGGEPNTIFLFLFNFGNPSVLEVLQIPRSSKHNTRKRTPIIKVRPADCAKSFFGTTGGQRRCLGASSGARCPRGLPSPIPIPKGPNACNVDIQTPGGGAGGPYHRFLIFFCHFFAIYSNLPPPNLPPFPIPGTMLTSSPPVFGISPNMRSCFGTNTNHVY